jgi:hypothetical protein
MKAAQVMGLIVNMQKTKCMGVTKRPKSTKMLKTDDQEYEGVKEFKYLETILTDDNYSTTEIKQRIIMANKTSYGLMKQLNAPNLQRQTKCVLCKTLIRPILTYGSECWPLSKKDGNMLQIFERRILRTIYGPINENGMWRTRDSNELYTLYDEIDIVKVIRLGRWMWLGHLCRMQELNP